MDVPLTRNMFAETLTDMFLLSFVKHAASETICHLLVPALATLIWVAEHLLTKMMWTVRASSTLRLLWGTSLPNAADL